MHGLGGGMFQHEAREIDRSQINLDITDPTVEFAFLSVKAQKGF